MSVETIKTPETERVDAKKRAFMKKFGKYAVVGAGMATLMTPSLSSANNYAIKGRAKVKFSMPGENEGDIIAGGKWRSKAIHAGERNWDGYFHRVDEDRYKSTGIFTYKERGNLQSGTWKGVWNYRENKNKWVGKGVVDIGNDGTVDGHWKAWRKAGSDKIRWTVTGL
ncbi:hypothetical protein [Hydrogenimonas urashimensis]|uniref:hypothetical protein n=1 Tax=Hydrogenimonas urashimensis TaxID=2740515 RepID=UPI001915059A|nr:hypothetical protein [Hydrogenimonas urashimensis]